MQFSRVPTPLKNPATDTAASTPKPAAKKAPARKQTATPVADAPGSRKPAPESGASATGAGAYDLVVVESPAKAKTINKYLGPGFRVLASYGHVRDLPTKNGSVLPDKDFEMHWDVEPKAAKRLDEIAKAVKGAKKLILATDPDREGE